MSDPLTTRFVVLRSTRIIREKQDYALTFLTPLAAWMENSPPPDDDPAADVIWETELDAAKGDFSFTTEQRDQDGSQYPPHGIEIVTDSTIDLGTIIDMELHVIGKRPESFGSPT